MADQLTTVAPSSHGAAPPPANHVAIDLRELGVIDYPVASALLATHRDLRRNGNRLLIKGGPLEVTWFVELASPDADLELIVQRARVTD